MFRKETLDIIIISEGEINPPGENNRQQNKEKWENNPAREWIMVSETEKYVLESFFYFFFINNSLHKLNGFDDKAELQE